MPEDAAQHAIPSTFTRAAHALAVLLLATLAACTPDPTDPQPQSPDAANTPRLAVLSPALADTLRDLNHANTIVARHRYDPYYPHLPTLGDNLAIDYEQLAKLKPTHLILESSESAPPPRLDAVAKSLGTTIVRIPNLSLDDVRASIPTLDALAAPVQLETGSQHQNQSPYAAEMLRRFDDAMSPLPEDAIAAAGPTLALLDHAAAFGPGSFHHDLLLTLGLDAIPATGAPFIRLTAEDITVLNPATIIIFTPEPDPGSPLDQLGPLKDLSIDAVRFGRVFIITHDRVLLPSTALIETADQLREQLVPSTTPEPSG